MEIKNISGEKLSNRSNSDDSHLGQLAKKVRVRSPYSFANINLLGKCNVDCYFCLGKDLEKEFDKYQTLQTHFSEWINWENFVNRCKEYNIPQIYITGQNTDSLLYRHLEELIQYLKNEGFYVGLRTNALLAKKKMNIINQCTTCWGDAVSYSVHTLKMDTQKKIWKTPFIPDWDWVIRNTTAKMRIAIVLTRHNVEEVDDIIKYLSKYPNVEYVQVRKICTDNRYELLKEDMEAFEDYEKIVASKYPKVKSFETANVYEIYGKEVSFWRTVGTTVNSINYFSNGILSDDYFVIEGYSLEKGIELGTDKFL
jgi:molybdenum cofactor biosynthesis enzyme MoaA